MNEGSEKPKPLLKYWRVRGVAAAGLVAGFLVGLVIFGPPWHLPPAWGDIPSWISAVATVGLLIGAIITARYAIKAFRTQSEQLTDQRKINAEQTEVLGLQAIELWESIDERKREATQRRRAQAARVYIGAPSKPGLQVLPYVKNASDFPIYEAKLWYLNEDELTLSDWDDGYLGTILPDENLDGTHPIESKDARSRTILTFRDANDVRWIRMRGGVLKEMPGDVLEEQSAPATRESVRAMLPALPPGTRQQYREATKGPR